MRSAPRANENKFTHSVLFSIYGQDNIILNSTRILAIPIARDSVFEKEVSLINSDNHSEILIIKRDQFNSDGRSIFCTVS